MKSYLDLIYVQELFEFLLWDLISRCGVLAHSVRHRVFMEFQALRSSGAVVGGGTVCNAVDLSETSAILIRVFPFVKQRLTHLEGRKPRCSSSLRLAFILPLIRAHAQISIHWWPIFFNYRSL